MKYIEDRVTQPPPIDELENRWSRVREVMCANNVDALIVSGQHGFSGARVSGAGHPCRYRRAIPIEFLALKRESISFY